MYVLVSLLRKENRSTYGFGATIMAVSVSCESAQRMRGDLNLRRLDSCVESFRVKICVIAPAKACAH